VSIAPDRGPVPTLSELFDLWIERRKKAHRSADEDAWRWKKHLKPLLGHLQPAAVDSALLRHLIEKKLGEKLSPTTVRLLVLEVSGIFSDLVEQGHAEHNPVRLLPKSTRRLIRPAHDSRTTPFVERLDDVRRIYTALPRPTSIAYALGALAGLRTGEVLALRWAHVDMAARRIHVRESIDGPLKDDDSRMVPIQDALHPVLAAWKLHTGGLGRVVPPMRSDGEYLDPHTVRRHLAKAIKDLKIPKMTWYQATRHTFASHWVMQGGAIEKLREVLGQLGHRHRAIQPPQGGAVQRQGPGPHGGGSLAGQGGIEGPRRRCRARVILIASGRTVGARRKEHENRSS
jgi:integrase